MKKLLAVLLCIVMMLSMVACGGNQGGNETPDNNEDNSQVENNSQSGDGNQGGEDVKTEPTAEEWEAIDQYRLLLKKLEDYEKKQEISLKCEKFGIEAETDYVSGMEALGVCYDLISKLDAVDKWVGTDYISEDCDRRTVLNKFSVVKDVLLKEEQIYEDHLGNEEDVKERTWTYNADGTVRSAPASYTGSNSIHPWETRSLVEQIESNPCCVPFRRHFYVYDANGQIEKIEYKYSEDGEVYAVGKFTYNGDLVAEGSVVNADGREDTVSYTYNSNGQLTEMTAIEGNVHYRYKYVYTYEYNDRGQVTKETVDIGKEDYHNENSYEFHGLFVITYTYDANGFLSAATCKHTKNWNGSTATTTDEFTYTCDDQGRVVSIKIDCGNRIMDDSGEVAWKEEKPVCNVAFTYGNYYIYNIPVAAE